MIRFRFALLLLALAITTGTASAQLTLVNITPDKTGLDADVEASFRLYITTSSPNTIPVLAERVQDVTTPYHQSQFCWEVQCYDFSTSLSPNPDTLYGAGDTIKSFVLYIYPNGFPGTSSTTFRFYPQGFPDNYVEHTFTATFEPNSTNPALQTNLALGQAYPNPASQRVHFDLNLNRNTRLDVLNLQGQVVRTQEVSAFDPVAELNVAELPQGMYWARLAGQPGAARCFVVQ